MYKPFFLQPVKCVPLSSATLTRVRLAPLATCAVREGLGWGFLHLDVLRMFMSHLLFYYSFYSVFGLLLIEDVIKTLCGSFFSFFFGFSSLLSSEVA